MDSKMNLQDTCGVHSLHGMPGVFAAITSCIYIATMGLSSDNKGFPNGEVNFITGVRSSAYLPLK